jgi:hypothetical protein
MAELALIALSVLLCGYVGYVGALVIQADFYSRPQKLLQLVIILLLPLLGVLVVHWFYRMHRAEPYRHDRGFIPQHDPAPDEWRAFHRPPDPPGG